MTFTKKIWIDRQVEHPARRKLTETGTLDVYDVSREEGLIVQEGDSLSAANLNDLENRIDASIAGVESKADLALPAIQKGAANGIATLDGTSKVTADQTSAKYVFVSAHKTLALSDAGACLSVSSAATITIPSHATVGFSNGTEIEILRYGTGAVTIAAVSAVTILCSKPERTIADQYTSAILKKAGDDIWLLQGNVG